MSQEIPEAGDQVIYFNDNKRPCPAFITFVHSKLSRYCDRPICNLAIFTQRGYSTGIRGIEPAHHDGTRWILLSKYAYPQEISEDNYELSPEDNAKIIL